jgi:tRNA pseudouridine55 synthase
MNQILIINKPVGLTSMDVIRRIRKKYNIKKAGHAGTLDPLASGILIICTGKETKNIQSFMNMEKEYITIINLSAFSETDDAEGQLTTVNINQIPTIEEITHILKNFIGEIDQTPPKYSAIKINGQPAYKRVRNGEQVELKSRKVKIEKIEIIDYKWPELKINVICQKGTYIRSLARDLGIALKTGGYLQELSRTRIGNFKLENAELI